MWILTVVFRALKCSLFFLLEKLCSSLQLSSGLRKRWTCCCGNIRSLCTCNVVIWSPLEMCNCHWVFFLFFSCTCLLFSSTVLIFVTSLVPTSLSCYYLASSNLLSVSTERPLPPRKMSVPQDEVESRQLRVHWVTGGSASSPLRYFTLQIKELPNGDWKTHTADIPHNMTSWTVDRYTHTCTYAQLQWLICHPLNLWHFIYRQFKVQYSVFFITLFKPKTQKKKWFF